jgi:hypothetical protein
MAEFSSKKKYFNSQNLNYFAFCPKYPNPIKAVIQHLPGNTPVGEIYKGLVELVFDTISVKQMCAILERFQSKALRLITDTPWYVPNAVNRRDLQLPSIKEEISRLSARYSARLILHTNHLVTQLSMPPPLRKLRKHHPYDLPNRFRD